MTRAGIALGSNLGGRRAHLAEAVRRIDRLPGTRVTARSGLWESEPVDCPAGSGAFLNAVVEVETIQSPMDLLDRLQRIESSLGRPRIHAANSPRTIDLDILYYGEAATDHPRLKIPHPHAAARAFVLLPLEEVRPGLTLPGCGLSVRELVRRLSARDLESVRRKGELA